MQECVLSRPVTSDSANPRTAAHQALPSINFQGRNVGWTQLHGSKWDADVENRLVGTEGEGVQSSRPVVSDSLSPRGLQHTRPPCPSPTPKFTQTHVHGVGDAIQPFHPLSSPSLSAFNCSRHQGFFQFSNISELFYNFKCICVYMHIYTYIYIYTYIHTHTHT